MNNLHHTILAGPWRERARTRRGLIIVHEHEEVPGLERYDTKASSGSRVIQTWRYKKKFYRRVREVRNAILLAQGADPALLEC